MEFKFNELNDVTAAETDWGAVAAIGAGVVVGILICD